ncbi:MAG: DNA polymerase IV [Deltaproteobacteria bacterium]|nr:DNA polymerase IV [Deltaproteobacteria bacterium]
MRIIGHLDMDAFFAAVEELDHPEFRGLPLVVGADPAGGRGRGVVSTANYLARRYGIHSAMPITRAWRASETARRRGEPPVVFVRPRFRRYSEISRRIMTILRRHSPLVEEGGIDEAYFELSSTGSYEEAAALCRKIKAEIKAQEQLTASVGIGPNKMVAKIASDFKKPDGLTVVTPEAAEDFLAPLPVRKIPGIGPKTEGFLARQGVKIVADLKRFSPPELEKMLGKWGLALYEKVRGRSSAVLVEEWEPKSVGEQETFGQDTLDLAFIFERLWDLCQGVWRRLQAEGFQTYRTVVVTVRFADFDTHSRAYTLPYPTQSRRTLVFEAMRLLMPFLDRRENPRRKLIRLIGVRVEKIGK